MNVTYTPPGGTAILLKICHFNDFQQNAVYSDDGTDYLYTHFVVDVTCVWNQSATASSGRQPIQPPVGQAGDSPAVSLSTLRPLLLLPRGELIVDVGGTIILGSPEKFDVPIPLQNLAPCDAKNGPVPVACNVTSFWGLSTAIVRYRIETWLVEKVNPQTSLLSNRWVASESIADDFRSTIHVEGTAYFRTDLFALANQQDQANAAQFADDMRSLVIPPQRNGFQRRNLIVTLSSDGTRMNWAFDDEQQIYMLNVNCGIYRARGYTSVETDRSGGLFGIPGLRLPELSLSMHVEVWGVALASRRQLANACVRIVAGSGNFDVNAPEAIKMKLAVDFPERHASLDMIYLSNGIIGGVDAMAGDRAIVNFWPQVRLFDDFDVPGIWVQGAGAQPVIQPGGGGICGDGFLQRDRVLTLLPPIFFTAGLRPPLPAVTK